MKNYVDFENYIKIDNFVCNILKNTLIKKGIDINSPKNYLSYTVRAKNEFEFFSLKNKVHIEFSRLFPWFVRDKWRIIIW